MQQGGNKDEHFPYLLLQPTRHLESQSWATVVPSKGTQKFSKRSWTASETSRSLFDPLVSVGSKENLKTKLKYK